MSESPALCVKGKLKQFLYATYHYDAIIHMNDTVSDRRLRMPRHLLQVGTASRQELSAVIPDASRITLIRDLNYLQAKGLAIAAGKGPEKLANA